MIYLQNTYNYMSRGLTHTTNLIRPHLTPHNAYSVTLLALSAICHATLIMTALKNSRVVSKVNVLLRPERGNRQPEAQPTPLQLLIRQENISDDEVIQFFENHPNENINALDNNRKTCLYRAIWRGNPSIKLMTELLKRNAEYISGNPGISLDELKDLMERMEVAAPVILGILSVLQAGKEREQFLDYLYAQSIADYSVEEANLANAVVPVGHRIDIEEGRRLSRLAAAIILDFQELELRVYLPVSNEMLRMTNNNELDAELRDPALIIVSYLRDLRNQNDLNKVSSNLRTLRTYAGMIEEIKEEKKQEIAETEQNEKKQETTEITQSEQEEADESKMNDEQNINNINTNINNPAYSLD